jgi:transposase
MANKNVPPKKQKPNWLKLRKPRRRKGMVSTNMFGRIQEFKSLGYSKRKTARELKLDKRTVKKYWEMDNENYARYVLECKERAKILDPYRGFIVSRLEEHSEITGAIIEDHLREKYPDFGGSSRSVRMYVADLRKDLGLPTPARIRQYCEVEELPAGFQAQVDMGQKKMKDVFGKSVKVYVFAMVLSCSRKKFVYFQDKPFNGENFIKAHDLAFRYFSGRPTEIVYDQDRVMAVSENAGDLILTEVFENYYKFAGFSIRLCRGNDPQSKGKIEAVVKYVKNNFLTCRTYFGISQLCSDGLKWLDRTANGRIHETTKMVPDHVFNEEIKHLKSVPFLSEPVLPKTAIIRKTNIVPYRQNRYELPFGTYRPGRQAVIEIDIEKREITFSDSKTGEFLAIHKIAEGVIGKLIKLPKNADRFKKVKYDELKKEVISGFNENSMAITFVDKIIEKYPRYTRDQLSILKKSQDFYEKEKLLEALNYCTAHELFSATDFRDTLEYFKTMNPAVKKSTNIKISEKYRSIRAQTRSISEYSRAVGARI